MGALWVRRAVCAPYVAGGVHCCTQLKTIATGLAVTMPGGAASMSVHANANQIGIMAGILAVTTKHICMSWITAMATGRVSASTMVILATFAKENLFVMMVLRRSA